VPQSAFRNSRQNIAETGRLADGEYAGTLFTARSGDKTAAMPPDNPPRWSDEDTTDPHTADRRNFYKVEKWTPDGLHIEALLYAGNNLDKALATFDAAVKHRPAIIATVRQRARVLRKWPVPWPGE
jgi:hypothetical protein